MAEKKDPCRFTVMFNRADPNHLRVVGVLNQQKHRKAQFIVNAVLHYLNCPETPAIQEPAPLDKQAILEIVTQYLKTREQGDTANIAENMSSPTFAGKQRHPLEKSITTGESALDEEELMLGADGLEAIADTMASFFRK